MSEEKQMDRNDLNEKGSIQISENNTLLLKNQGTGKWYTLLASNSIKDRYLIDTSYEGHKEYAVIKGLDFHDGTWRNSLGYYNSLDDALVKYDCETVDLKKIPPLQLANLMESQEAIENMDKAMFARYVKEHLCVDPTEEFIEKNYAKYKVDKDRLFQTVELKDDKGKLVGTLLERVDEEYVHWKIEHDNYAYAQELANDLSELDVGSEEKFNAFLSYNELKDKDVYNLSRVICNDLSDRDPQLLLDMLNEKIQEEKNAISSIDNDKTSSSLEEIKENLQKLEQHVSIIKEQYMEHDIDIFEEIDEKDESLIKDILDDVKQEEIHENINPKNLKLNKEKEMRKNKSIDKE